MAKKYNEFKNQAELSTDHYFNYFNNETCHEYWFDQINPYYGILNRVHSGDLFNQLKARESINQQLIYKKIIHRCNTENRALPNTYIKQHPRKELFNYNYGSTPIDKIVAKIICLSKTSNRCDVKISNQELDLVIRSKQNYIHEQVKAAKSQLHNNYLKKITANHLQTGHIGLAFSIYQDAQLLYQCKIGKDCSNTSLYMIQKCIYHQEFCGLDVETYMKKYKTSPSQFKEVQKALAFLLTY